MPGLGTSPRLVGRALRMAAAVVALSMIGASPNPMPLLAKADRAASPADCRFEEMAATIDCLGVVLPLTRGEVVDVGPGLTVVGQIPG